MSESEAVERLPLLPIRGTVLFPGLVMPLSVARPPMMASVEAALATEEKQLVVVAQRDAAVEEPSPADLFSTGTRAVIRRMARTAERSVDIIVQGLERVRVLEIETADGTLSGRVRSVPLPTDGGAEVEGMQRAVAELARRALALVEPQPPFDLGQVIESAKEDPLRLVYVLASLLGLDVDKGQALLEVESRGAALAQMRDHLTHEIQVLEVRKQITTQAATEMSREQRDYLLRQQLRAIQDQLGEKSPTEAEAELLRERLREADLPEEVREEAERELGRMEKLPPAAPDYHVARTHLDLILELPWRRSSPDRLDIGHVRQVLDEDHFELREVKQRILEHLGVLKLNPDAKAPILCLVGPPGVGKTSLGQSIARALDRKFERLSVGGLHDEAELRGHRRTYVGAMPGRIIQAIRRAGVNNPVLMLDEVDKLGRDFRGDPAAALLEILDPEQNRSFRDNYLDLPFDLSKVFFLTTANTLDTVPGPLVDRMEVLRLSGYSEEEKLEIAKRYLIPRQLAQAGLDASRLAISDEVTQRVISRYTREAGLRQLERTLGRLARRAALEFAEGRTEPIAVRVDQLAEWLGAERFLPEEARRDLPPGVATGLAWTEAGGDVLYIEATLLPEARGLTLTGQLGGVMQESARAAHSWVWSHAEALGVERSRLRRSGVHIHVPAGAVPKDGPSAGMTMAMALASLYAQASVRSDTAMTGEMSLTGLILPIGGVKEKILAARRAGIHRVLLPKGNEKDLRELPERVRAGLEILLVSRIEEALAAGIPALAERLRSHQAA